MCKSSWKVYVNIYIICVDSTVEAWVSGPDWHASEGDFSWHMMMQLAFPLSLCGGHLESYNESLTSL